MIVSGDIQLACMGCGTGHRRNTCVHYNPTYTYSKDVEKYEARISKKKEGPSPPVFPIRYVLIRKMGRPSKGADNYKENTYYFECHEDLTLNTDLNERCDESSMFKVNCNMQCCRNNRPNLVHIKLPDNASFLHITKKKTDKYEKTEWVKFSQLPASVFARRNNRIAAANITTPVEQQQTNSNANVQANVITNEITDGEANMPPLYQEEVGNNASVPQQSNLVEEETQRAMEDSQHQQLPELNIPQATNLQTLVNTDVQAFIEPTNLSFEANQSFGDYFYQVENSNSSSTFNNESLENQRLAISNEYAQMSTIPQKNYQIDTNLYTAIQNYQIDTTLEQNDQIGTSIYTNLQQNNQTDTTLQQSDQVNLSFYTTLYTALQQNNQTDTTLQQNDQFDTALEQSMKFPTNMVPEDNQSFPITKQDEKIMDRVIEQSRASFDPSINPHSISVLDGNDWDVAIAVVPKSKPSLDDSTSLMNEYLVFPDETFSPDPDPKP